MKSYCAAFAAGSPDLGASFFYGVDVSWAGRLPIVVDLCYHHRDYPDLVGGSPGCNFYDVADGGFVNCGADIVF